MLLHSAFALRIIVLAVLNGEKYTRFPKYWSDCFFLPVVVRSPKAPGDSAAKRRSARCPAPPPRPSPLPTSQKFEKTKCFHKMPPCNISAAVAFRSGHNKLGFQTEKQNCYKASSDASCGDPQVPGLFLETCCWTSDPKPHKSTTFVQ